MTNAPGDLLGLRSTLQTLTGLSAVDVGIVGDAAHARSGGYHIGRSGLQAAGVWSTDYSVRLQRDRNGCTESASAVDVGAGWRQGRATWLKWNNLLANALRANDPALTAVRAINYSPNGTLKWRIDREYGWRTDSSADTVDIHTHIEWYRDTEGRRQQSLDRIAALAQQAITGQVAPMGETHMAVTDLRVKLLYENWAPTRDEWIKAGGAAATYDLLAQDGSGQNNLAIALNAMDEKLDQLLARPAATVDVPALAAALEAAGVGQVDVAKLAAALQASQPSHITLTGTVTP